MQTILVTGGAGFIGSNFVRLALAEQAGRVVVLDKLTYAGNLANLDEVAGHPRYVFVHGDIADRETVSAVFATHRPTAVLNFAAESHVDRSIDGPATSSAPTSWAPSSCSRRRGATPPSSTRRERERFRFLHVSTDEVYGSLGADRRSSARTPPTPPTRPTPPPRPAPITWCAPTTTPTACRRWSPTARTTTAPTSSPRS